MKATRRQARETAMQALFFADLNEGTTNDTLRTFAIEQLKFPPLESFTIERILGVRQNLAEIDNLLQMSMDKWAVLRIPAVDRAILRLAVFELRFCADVPPKVAINEAIEIAKRFGANDSPRFVNGVLDRIARDLEHRRAKSATEAGATVPEPTPNETETLPSVDDPQTEPNG